MDQVSKVIVKHVVKKQKNRKTIIVGIILLIIARIFGPKPTH